jgi:hypothetical protein
VVSVPGIGFQKSDCGAWVRKLQSGDAYRDIYHNCDRLGCPVCMSGVLDRKARAAGDRFSEYEKLLLDKGTVLVPGELRGVKPRYFLFTLSPDKVRDLVEQVCEEMPGEWGEQHHALFLM